MKTLIHTSLSRKRSHKSPRSSFMSMLMTKLGGDTGNDIAQAFVKPDPDKFQDLMGAVVDSMAKSINRTPPKVEASSDGSADTYKLGLTLLKRFFPKAKRAPANFKEGGAKVAYVIVPGEPKSVASMFKLHGFSGRPSAGRNTFDVFSDTYPGIRVQIGFAEDLEEDESEEWGIGEDEEATMISTYPDTSGASGRVEAASALRTDVSPATSLLNRLNKVVDNLTRATKQASALLKKGDEKRALQLLQDYEDVADLWEK